MAYSAAGWLPPPSSFSFFLLLFTSQGHKVVFPLAHTWRLFLFSVLFIFLLFLPLASLLGLFLLFFARTKCLGFACHTLVPGFDSAGKAIFQLPVLLV